MNRKNRLIYIFILTFPLLLTGLEKPEPQTTEYATNNENEQEFPDHTPITTQLTDINQNLATREEEFKNLHIEMGRKYSKRVYNI